MNPNNKRLFRGWIAGIALGLGSSAALVYAVSIPHTFTAGTTASARQVNENFAAMKNSLDALEADARCAGDAVVRIGPLCFDRFRARADFAGCAPDGSDCTVAATSTSEGAPAVDMSWAQAARACANAGKRLPLPGEWLVAFASGQLEETGVDQLELVNVFLALNSLDPALDPSSPGIGVPVQAGYMGPRSAAGNLVQLITNIAYHERDADGGTDFIFFRCVR